MKNLGTIQDGKDVTTKEYVDGRYTNEEKTKLAELADIKTIGAGLRLTDAGELKIGVPNTWEDIQEVTRRGIAPSVIEVGKTYTFQRDGVDVTVACMGFIENGRHGGLKIKNNNLKYGVIFQTLDCLYSLQFDEREAFYYAPDGLAAGDYYFKLGQHTWFAADVGKNFYFHLSKAVPAGGQLVWKQGYDKTLEGGGIDVFDSGNDFTANETVTMSSTEIAGATNLGTINNAFTGNFNSCQRALLGNNRWKESAMRQHLNSDAVAGSVWTPQNHWDRPPSWRTSTKGFMNGLASSFLPYVAEVEVDTYRNTVCDGGGYDTTVDKFFLAGRMELYMPSEASADNNAPWAFYANGSQYDAPNAGADPIRSKHIVGASSNTYWWMRSPLVGSAGSVRSVSPDGSNNYYNAFYSYGVAPAFIIA